MLKVLFLLCLGLPGILFSQYDIRWSELMSNKGRIAQIFPVSYTDFYTTRYQGSMLIHSLYLNKHSNFAVTAKGKITPKLEQGIGMVEQVVLLNKVPLVFISDKKEGENRLYFQKYDGTCKPQGKPVLIGSYVMPKRWKRKGEFWVHLSENKEFFCVDYEIPGSKEERDRFGYKVYDNYFKLISEGEYELPYASDLVSISNNYLSNSGDYFLAAKVYKNTGEKRMFKSVINLDKVVLMHVTPKGVKEFDLKLKNNKQISELAMSSDHSQIMSFTGLYGSEGGVSGVFYYQLNFVKNEVVAEGWNEFKKDFIVTGWSERAIEKAKKMSEKGKGEPELYDYDVREMQTLADGSMIGMLEQYFVRQVQTYNAQTKSYSTTYYYYYNDVIVYKINPSGSFEWLKKIPKYQVSTNDGGYFSSVASIIKGDKLTMIFNDNLKNYDESGQFNQDFDRMFAASYRKRTNAVALVEFDLNTGEYTRKVFFDRKETKAYAVPKKFVVDYEKNEMLMVLIYGKKEKYGLLSIE